MGWLAKLARRSGSETFAGSAPLPVVVGHSGAPVHSTQGVRPAAVDRLESCSLAAESTEGLWTAYRKMARVYPCLRLEMTGACEDVYWPLEQHEKEIRLFHLHPASFSLALHGNLS